MARRNPMNERYQKHTAPEGKTRKSAAAAKPKRSSGAEPTKKPSQGKPPAGGLIPDTEEYRRTRKIWWGLLIGAMVFVTIAWYLQQYTDYKQAGYVVLGLAYGSIFSAIWLDFTRLRRMREEWRKNGGKAPKADVEKKADEPKDHQSDK